MEKIRARMGGDSMIPELKHGDYLSIEKMDYSKHMYWPGHIHVIELNDGQEVVRRLYDEGDNWRLKAENKEIPEQMIPKEIVKNIYRVVASARLYG